MTPDSEYLYTPMRAIPPFVLVVRQISGGTQCVVALRYTRRGVT